MTPQLIFLVMTALGIGMAISDHGKPRKPENAWHSIIGTVVILSLLYWGGFFDCFKQKKAEIFEPIWIESIETKEGN